MKTLRVQFFEKDSHELMTEIDLPINTMRVDTVDEAADYAQDVLMNLRTTDGHFPDQTPSPCELEEDEDIASSSNESNIRYVFDCEGISYEVVNLDGDYFFHIKHTAFFLSVTASYQDTKLMVDMINKN